MSVNLSVNPVVFACVFKFDIFISTCSMLLKEVILETKHKFKIQLLAFVLISATGKTIHSTSFVQNGKLVKFSIQLGGNIQLQGVRNKLQHILLQKGKSRYLAAACSASFKNLSCKTFI